MGAASEMPGSPFPKIIIEAISLTTLSPRCYGILSNQQANLKSEKCNTLTLFCVEGMNGREDKRDSATVLLAS
jgi:hypothetical protein